ncbi:MAG: thermostable hemolysin [Thermodesulfobacteriota bacterium]
MEYSIGKLKFDTLKDLSLSLMGEGHGERDKVEGFAARVYRKMYGAELRTFCRDLLTLSVNKGETITCIGVNTPESGPFFLEQYLDSPVEEEISRLIGERVNREEIAEVGTMAVRSRGLCRIMMAGLTGYLMSRQKRFVVFTAVKVLRNTLERLGVPFVTVARAVPERVRDNSSWGSYYDASPEVVVIDMERCLTHMEKALDGVGYKARNEAARMMNDMFFKGLLLEEDYKLAAGF